MRMCQDSDCSGIVPCESCAMLRRLVLMRAVKDAEMTKEQAEAFFRAYAEAFDVAVKERERLVHELAHKRLEEKEAREKKVEKQDTKPDTKVVRSLRAVAQQTSNKPSIKKTSVESSEDSSPKNGVKKDPSSIVEGDSTSTKHLGKE